jgi:hypothetical protein
MRARPGTPRSIEHQHLRKSTGADGFVSSSIPPVDLAAAPRGLRHFPSTQLSPSSAANSFRPATYMWLRDNQTTRQNVCVRRGFYGSIARERGRWNGTEMLVDVDVDVSRFWFWFWVEDLIEDVPFSRVLLWLCTW